VGGLMERSRHFGVGLVLPCPHSEAALRRSPDPIPVLAAVAVAPVLIAGGLNAQGIPTARCRPMVGGPGQK
jgi:hypothetical protein